MKSCGHVSGHTQPKRVRDLQPYSKFQFPPAEAQNVLQDLREKTDFCTHLTTEVSLMEMNPTEMV